MKYFACGRNNKTGTRPEYPGPQRRFPPTETCKGSGTAKEAVAAESAEDVATGEAPFKGTKEEVDEATSTGGCSFPRLCVFCKAGSYSKSH